MFCLGKWTLNLLKMFEKKRLEHKKIEEMKLKT